MLGVLLALDLDILVAHRRMNADRLSVFALRHGALLDVACLEWCVALRSPK